MGFTRFFFEYGRALGDADMEMIWDEHCHTQLTMRCELMVRIRVHAPL